MSGPRGYSSYRGKGSKLKIALAVFLVLVILAAVAVIRLQKYVVYDDSGRPRLELPGREEPPAAGSEDPDSPIDPDLTIQEPEGLQALYAYAVTETPLTVAGWESLRTAHLASSSLPYNAAVYTAKDAEGYVYYDSQTAPANARKTVEGTGAAIGAMVNQEGLYTVARLSCFRDGIASVGDLEGMGLKNTGGYIFYDGNNERWLDPSKTAARLYLCELAAELAALGFDEILLTDVSYPDEGKLDKIDYGPAAEDLSLSLTSFVTQMREALREYDVALSIELPIAELAGAETAGQPLVSGQSLAALAPLVDRVYADVSGSMDAVEQFRLAVARAGGKTDFVPEIPAGAEGYTGPQLVLS